MGGEARKMGLPAGLASPPPAGSDTRRFIARPLMPSRRRMKPRQKAADVRDRRSRRSVKTIISCLRLDGPPSPGVSVMLFTLDNTSMLTPVMPSHGDQVVAAGIRVRGARPPRR